MLGKNYTPLTFLNRYGMLDDGKRILNAGSSSTRYGHNCLNVDLAPKQDVDLVCDLHALPETLEDFDVVICNAVLQYCRSPREVARQFYRVLKPGGLLFVDAPWVQPFYLDTPDRYRFSQNALIDIFEDFELVEVGPSITSGLAFHMLAVEIAQKLTGNRYVDFVLGRTVAFLLYPLKGLRTRDESRTAGAFYLICRKPLPAAPPQAEPAPFDEPDAGLVVQPSR